MNVQAETRKHIARVGELLHKFAIELLKRADQHDASKLEEPEVSVFDRVTPRLRGLTYGSEKYKVALEDMGPALKHHYDANRHHPEHFLNGLGGMNLADLAEMICDWKAASERHDDGDIHRSIAQNGERFGYSTPLLEIFMNTVDDVLS